MTTLLQNMYNEYERGLKNLIAPKHINKNSLVYKSWLKGKKKLRLINRIFRNNEKNARYCIDCIRLHIGQTVSHNHCDLKYNDWCHDRANGKEREKCIYKLKFE